MRKIEGYVFMPHNERVTFMFGRRIAKTGSDGNYDNFEFNDFSPYKTRLEATAGARELLSKRQDATKADIARVIMEIAENKGEVELFVNKTNLVSIMIDEDQGLRILYGALVQGFRPAYPLPGAVLKDNGYVTYTRANSKPLLPFKRALYQAKEINRQGQLPATIATFKLKILETILRNK